MVEFTKLMSDRKLTQKGIEKGYRVCVFIDGKLYSIHDQSEWKLGKWRVSNKNHNRGFFCYDNEKGMRDGVRVWRFASPSHRYRYHKLALCEVEYCDKSSVKIYHDDDFFKIESRRMRIVSVIGFLSHRHSEHRWAKISIDKYTKQMLDLYTWEKP